MYSVIIHMHVVIYVNVYMCECIHVNVNANMYMCTYLHGASAVHSTSTDSSTVLTARLCVL